MYKKEENKIIGTYDLDEICGADKNQDVNYTIVPRKISLSSKHLAFYDLAVEKGYLGSLSEFVNDVIDKEAS